MTSAWRLSIQYGLIFAATGVSLPFAGLWFREHGLSGAEIGTLLAAPMLARLITGPLIAVWADGFRTRRRPLAILGLVAAAGYLAAGLVEGIALWLPLWFVAATAAAAMIPLTDALTVRLAAREGFGFSIPRGVGSATFVAANVIMGGLLVRAPVDAVIVWVVIATGLSGLWSALGAPAELVSATVTRKRDRFRGMGALLADPVFMTAIFAVGAMHASHAFLYGFSAIEWKARGVPESITGLLWAFSVLVEIGFMWVIEPWRRRRGFGLWPMLMLGVTAGMIRWTAYAFAPPLWALWPLQALHALSFAATFLAGVEIINRLSPPDAQTAAQTLNSTLSSGVLIGLATVASGPLYDAYGAGGYLAMTAMAALGGVAALRLRPWLSAAKG